MTSNDSTEQILSEIAKVRRDLQEANQRITERLSAMSERLDTILNRINGMTMPEVGALLQRIERLEAILKARGLLPGIEA